MMFDAWRDLIKNRTIYYTLFGVAITALLLHVAIFVRFTIDDAYITFAYSKNFASGDGLVFSRGARVEATSSMLWAILLTPFEMVMNQGAVLGSKILGVLCALGTLISGSFLISDILKSQRGNTYASLFFGFLLAGASPFVVWSIYGMEHGLVALLLMLSVLTFLLDMRRGTIVSVLVIFLLETVRPEGFIYVSVFAGARLMLGILPGNRSSIKSSIKWFLALGVCLAIYEIIGLKYYGHLLPNTVHAKVGSLSIDRIFSGLKYVFKDSGRLYSILLLLTLQLVAFRFWMIFPRDIKAFFQLLRDEIGVLLVSALLVIHWLFVIFVGGDWMTNARFLSHAIPLLLILLTVVLWQTAEMFPLRSPKVIALVCLLCINGLAFYSLNNIRFGYSSFKHQAKLQESEERALAGMATMVNELSSSDDAILACSDIGRPGYMYKGHILDWWGLADEEIARLGQAIGRVDPAVVLGRHPDFIVLYSNDSVLTSDSMNKGIAVYSKGFYHSPGFLENYKQRGSIYFWEDRWHVLFQRISRKDIYEVKD